MCRRILGQASSGFSLVEVLIAIGLVGGAVAGLSQLVAISVRANVSAQASTISAVLATQKMEQLRAEASGTSTGGSLQRDLGGFFDYLDAQGRQLSGLPGAGVSFVRRWSIGPLLADPVRSRVLRVRVVRVPGDAAHVPPWPGAGLDESRLLTLMTIRER